MRKPILRPCPYCGGMAYVATLMSNRYIDCQHKRKCIIKPNTWLISDKSLRVQIRAWNQRV